MARTLSEFSVDFHVEHWTSDDTAVVKFSRHGADTTYQMTWLPNPTLSAVSRLDRSDRLLVAGPRISSRTADALRDAHIDYVDQAGNAHLEIGPVLIDIRGRGGHDTRSSPRATGANLFSAKRMQVLFALLCWPGLAGMPVRTIADVARSSVGLTQSALDAMKEADYLIGRTLQRRDELLDLWAAAFRGSLLPKISEASLEGDIRRWSPPPGYLVSGESAVGDIKHPQTLTLYVENFDPKEAMKNGWHKSDQPNIEVRQKFWKEPQGLTIPDKSPAFVESAAPPTLVYADLITSREPRQAEVAGVLRRERLV